MNALEELKNSNAWDNYYNLPLCPETNNPHFYMALSAHILSYYSEFLPEGLIKNYQQVCEKEPGLYHRHADGSGGKTSHDELLGIAYLNKEAAIKILDYLDHHDGNYDNTGLTPLYPGKNNLYRFPWFICYLRAVAGYEINPLNYGTYLFRLLQDIFFYNYEKNRNEDSCLQTWMMQKEMKRFKLANYLYLLWVKRMVKRGVTHQKLFQTYLADHPWFKRWAQESWDV